MVKDFVLDRYPLPNLMDFLLKPIASRKHLVFYRVLLLYKSKSQIVVPSNTLQINKNGCKSLTLNVRDLLLPKCITFGYLVRGFRSKCVTFGMNLVLHYVVQDAKSDFGTNLESPQANTFLIHSALARQPGTFPRVVCAVRRCLPFRPRRHVQLI